MSTWEGRMSGAAALRREAIRAESERLEDEDRAALSALNPAADGEDYIETAGPHRGHWSHINHDAHLGSVMCQCGALLGVYGYALTEDYRPEPCPACTARGIPQA